MCGEWLEHQKRWSTKDDHHISLSGRYTRKRSTRELRLRSQGTQYSHENRSCHLTHASAHEPTKIRAIRYQKGVEADNEPVAIFTFKCRDRGKSKKSPQVYSRDRLTPEKRDCRNLASSSGRPHPFRSKTVIPIPSLQTS